MKTQKTNKSYKSDNLAADVVIIGGGAGLAAAIEAAENGAKVSVLERLKKTGGTALSFALNSARIAGENAAGYIKE